MCIPATQLVHQPFPLRGGESFTYSDHFQGHELKEKSSVGMEARFGNLKKDFASFRSA
jgi:hypothetical protein